TRLAHCSDPTDGAESRPGRCSQSESVLYGFTSRSSRPRGTARMPAARGNVSLPAWMTSSESRCRSCMAILIEGVRAGEELRLNRPHFDALSAQSCELRTMKIQALGLNFHGLDGAHRVDAWGLGTMSLRRRSRRSRSSGF